MGLSKKGIIIDAEAFHKFTNENHEDSKPIHKCIEKQTLQLVYGDDEKSLDEISKDSRMIDILIRLAKDGATYQVDSKRKTKEIDDNGGFVNCIKLKSWINDKKNDTHIIAIALIEKKARLLFSSDTRLHKDFRNPKIIKDPRGKVYQEYSKHSDLLP